MTVVPVANENRLRNLAWIEDNRRKVDQMTGGRVAYVYLPDTAFGGFTNFTRYFFAQVDKQAVIVDERFNGGGELATDIIEFLVAQAAVERRDARRRRRSRAAGRDLRAEGDADQRVRRLGRRRHAVVLPPRRRRQADRQTDVGRPGRPRRLAAADGRRLRHRAVIRGLGPAQSKWIVENVGISPDIEVEHDPEAVRHGHDPQLERAVQEILAELKKHPPKKLTRPTFPDIQDGQIRDERRVRAAQRIRMQTQPCDLWELCVPVISRWPPSASGTLDE